MKKFLCYTSLFTLIVLTVLAAFEWSLRRIPASTPQRIRH